MIKLTTVLLIIISTFSVLADENSINIPHKLKKTYVDKGCGSIEGGAEWLSEESKTAPSKNKHEAYSENIESLIFNKTNCILDSITLMSNENITYLIRNHLVSPLYSTAKEINMTLKPYKSKYPKFFKLYDKINNEKNR